MEIIIIVSTILTFLWGLIMIWRWRNDHDYSPIRNWPVIGMLPGILHNASRIHDYIAQVLKQSPYTFVFKGPWFTNTDYIFTSDPSNVHHILTKNFSNYSERPKFKTIMEPSGDGIFSAQDQSWRLQRRIVHSIVNKRTFESTVEKVIIRKTENGLMPILEHFAKLELVVDIQDVFQRFNFDSNSILILGFDPNSLRIEFPTLEYEKAYDDIVEGVIRRHMMPEFIWKIQKWLQVGEEKKFLRAWRTFDRFLYNCISLKREQLSKKNPETQITEFDLLTYLLTEVEAKSDKFLRDMAFNLLGAGRDTITSALTWCFWLISTHPTVENNILKEIKSNLNPKSNVFTCAKEVNKLVYLHAVLCETMRLYPPIPINHKTAAEPDVLPSGHRIERDDNIIMSFYAMGRMEEIWGKDCLEFKPERWISKKGEIIFQPSYTFPVFNGGPKSCLGKNISFVQLKMIASAILWNYGIEVVEGVPISLKSAMVLYLQHGLKVRVFKRK